MPRTKPTNRTMSKAKPATARPKKPASLKPTPARQNYTEEYADYLERYELYGEGRPKLSPSEYDRLDEEMLDLLALEVEKGVLDDEQVIRLQELEFLLLDSDQ